MKNKEEDLDDPLELNEDDLKKRSRQNGEADLPEPIRRLRESARQKLKDRVTIYFDADIVHTFKSRAEKEGVGYQTLMNQALRQFIDGSDEQKAVKESLLSDKKFLKKLKKALAA